VTSPAPPIFNPMDPAFLENPFPFYQLGRRMMPVFHFEQAGIWSVFGYENATNILKDNVTWRSAPPAGPDGAPAPESPMLFSDPPRHTRLRGLVSQAFTPRMIEQLEPRIAQIAAELLDQVVPAGACDIVEALAYPLPVIVIAEILGVPPEDRATFKEWSDTVVAQLGQGLGPDSQRQPPEATFSAMADYFTRMADERRAHPKNDLISGLVAAEVEGSRLSGNELIAMLILLLVAGNETTTNLIGNAVLEFMAHPAELQKVLDDGSLLPSAIEEVLRFSSPVQATVRRAARDIELGGQRIGAGQQTLVWLASANRDEAAFGETAGQFDVTRPLNPRHIAFGLGPHFCLGAPLARMEAKVALDAFLRRCKNFHRAGDGPLPRVPTFVMRGLRQLPIAFDPAM